MSNNFKNDKFNGLIGGGFNYDRSKFGDTSDHSTQPWMDASVQYSFNGRNSISADFHHATWTLASSYRSTAVIQLNPLFSYTGNPDVSPYKSYDLSLRYVYMPDNRFNFAAFGNSGLITDRYAYVYMASPDGVLRTIRQKGVGNFYELLYGVQGTARLLGNSLMINGQVAHRIVRNGAPFDWTRQRVLWYLQAFWYVGDWNFGLQYQCLRNIATDMSTAPGLKTKAPIRQSLGGGTHRGVSRPG